MTKKQILQILVEAFRLKPEERAAYELGSLGITEKEFLKITGDDSKVPSAWRVSVAGVLRDIERKSKKERKNA